MHAALTHPLGQRRLRDRQPGPTEDTFLAVQRQMVLVLGHQHLGEQAGGRDALVDDVRRHRRLHEGLTRSARPLAADVAFDGEVARGVVELLGHILADAAHRATTGASGRLGFVTDLGARQLRRQRLASGLALGRRALRGVRLQLLELFAHRRQIGLGSFLEELRLLGGQTLGTHAEAMPLVQRQFMREPLDLGLAPHELALLLDEQAAQGVSIQLIKVGGQRHG